MRPITIIIVNLILALAYLLTASVSAEEIEANGIIVLSKNIQNKINKEDVKMIFLGKKTMLDDGTKVIPIIPSDIDPLLLKSFNQRILKKSNPQVKAYWAKRIFTGKGKPPDSKNIDEILRLMESTTNIISFIPGNFFNEDKFRLVISF